MSETRPLVSVLLSVYNGEKYIKEAIDSILLQTYTNFELVIINDGSTDSTLEIIKKFHDPRIKIYTHANIGLACSLNIAAKRSKGEFLARQDADDISLPNRLEKQVNIFQKKPDVVLVGADTIMIDRIGKPLGKTSAPLTKKNALDKIFALTSPYVHGSLMLRRSTFESVGGYSERFITSQDFDLIIRMSLLANEFSAVPEILYKLRIHPTSITSKKWMLQIKNGMKCAKYINSHYSDAISLKSLLLFILKKSIIGCSSVIFPELVYWYKNWKSVV